jgi:hypothetical protein
MKSYKNCENSFSNPIQIHRQIFSASDVEYLSMTEREAGTGIDYVVASRASLELVSVFKETSRNFIFIFS